MKVRKLTWPRWVQLIFGAILPTICFSVMLPWGFALAILQLFGDRKDVRLLVWSAGGLGGLISLWLLILFGAEQICRFPALRWFSIITGFLGLGTASYLLVNTPLFSLPALALAGPVAVGLAYLPALLGGGRPTVLSTIVLFLIAIVLATFLIPLGRF